MEHVIFHPAAIGELGDVIAAAPQADQWLIRSDLRLLNEFGESFFALVEVGDEAHLVECWMRRELTYVVVMQRRKTSQLYVLAMCCVDVGEPERYLALERARARRYP